MSWWSIDVTNRWAGAGLLFFAVLALLIVVAGLFVADGQCGHPTVQGGLCRRPLAPGRTHCGIPAHRQDWKTRNTITALVAALAGMVLLAFHPLPRHDLATPQPLAQPPVASYTPTAMPSPTTPSPTGSGASDGVGGGVGPGDGCGPVVDLSAGSGVGEWACRCGRLLHR